MNISFLIRIITCTLLVVPLHAEESSTLHILALVPMVQGNETTLPVENWRRGWEMIPGANLAIDMINNDSTILQDTFLKLITINSNADDSFDSLVDFMRVFTTRESNNIVAIIGMFFNKEIEIFSPLADKFNISLQLLTSMSPKIFNRERFPQQFHMVQSTSVLVRALFSLMEFYNWTGPSVITSGSDPLYLLITEEILTTSKQNPSKTIKKVYNYLAEDRLTSNIVIISMNIKNAVNLICTAHSKDLVWPKYAWIVLSHSVNDFILHATAFENNTNCIASHIMEGIIFIHRHLTVQNHDSKLISGLTYNNLSRMLQHRSLAPKVNPYAYVLHDAIWTVALALNESNETDISATLNDIDFTGASGPVKFVNNERAGLAVDIVQVRSENITQLGKYVNNNLTIMNHIRDFHPTRIQTRSTQSASTAYVAISYSNMILCTIFTTLVLGFYLHFRERPAIKATSTLISMMIFLSCYLTLFYMSILNVVSLPLYWNLSDSYHAFTCIIRIWLNGLAIPTNLAISTLIVKMIRVYRIFKMRIFKKPSSIRGCKCHYDSLLFLQIFLFMIPNLVILILWSTVDTYEIKIIYYYRDAASGEVLAVEQCDSDYLLVWLILLLLYLVILMVSLVVVAVKTRKIRYKNFKDTKKVNALIFMVVPTIVLALSYWFIIRSIQDSNPVTEHAVLQIGTSAMVYELMGFLFVPKIYPLIKEKWFTKCSKD